jgi:hypothetical protein
MKNVIQLLFASALMLTACKKNIDRYPLNNVTINAYYKNTAEVQIALNGCYAGLRSTMLEEWQMTELRSDNSIMGNAGSTSVPNREKSDLDQFIPSTSLAAIYTYWSSVYFNIKNINTLLNSLEVNYDPAAGTISRGTTTVEISENALKELSAQAAFLRAYHYFNLVRLYGGVFLVHEPINGTQATALQRATVNDIYKFIIADLQYAIANGVSSSYSAFIAANSGSNVGKVNAWTAKAYLAKVYLTLNRKSDALVLLDDVIANSGYGLLATGVNPYADIFSISNEMNREVMFAVRYKAGGIGIGSPWPNTFAPELSGTAVVNGDGDGFNTGTIELEQAYSPADLRKAVNVAVWSSGNNRRVYARKHITPVNLVDDGENDWIVLRYADIVLMKAEASGYSAASLSLINLTRARAGLGATPLTLTSVPTEQRFADSLSRERRLEFAFENVRWYDLLRFNTTLPAQSQDAVARMKAHIAFMFASHYGRYPAPVLSLATLQSYVTNERLLLPIPQREIDTNTKIKIEQNPGY